MSALDKARGVAYYGIQVLTDLLEDTLDRLEAWHARQPRDTRPDPTRALGNGSGRTTRRLETGE